MSESIATRASLACIHLPPHGQAVSCHNKLLRGGHHLADLDRVLLSRQLLRSKPSIQPSALNIWPVLLPFLHHKLSP